MPDAPPRMRLSRQAAGELAEMFETVVESSGLEQAYRRRDELRRVLERLAADPLTGRQANRLGRNIRRHRHGSHEIIYQERPEGIVVLSLVHSRRLAGLETQSE